MSLEPQKEYIAATEEMASDVINVLHSSIRAVYPNYYPQEVVEFFCDLHNDEHVLDGIRSGNMGVLMVDGEIVGVGCADGNHITSVYVRPECQGKGYGTFIMNRLEERISESHDTAVLDASLPAAVTYEHRGYKTTGHGEIALDGGATLVYEIMEKAL